MDNSTLQRYSDRGLLGMDLVRLGLERGETAFSALKIIIDLLEEYGQGGNCAEHFSMNYHNSFLIADCDEAWVLETAGKYWVAERAKSGTRSISNNLSIRGRGDMRHEAVIKDAIAMGLRWTRQSQFCETIRVMCVCMENLKAQAVRYLLSRKKVALTGSSINLFLVSKSIKSGFLLKPETII